jgi:hypothetical protein
LPLQYIEIVTGREKTLLEETLGFMVTFSAKIRRVLGKLGQDGHPTWVVPLEMKLNSQLIPVLENHVVLWNSEGIVSAVLSFSVEVKNFLIIHSG